MRIRWYGQSAFLLSGERTVFIDPFGPMEGLAERDRLSLRDFGRSGFRAEQQRAVGHRARAGSGALPGNCG
jgi:L-ascorbate metabolism protein UlaG (beta-lactamase superfamily)